MSVRGEGGGRDMCFVTTASLPGLYLDQTFPFSNPPCPALGSLPERGRPRVGSIFLVAPLIKVIRPVSYIALVLYLVFVS